MISFKGLGELEKFFFFVDRDFILIFEGVGVCYTCKGEEYVRQREQYMYMCLIWYSQGIVSRGEIFLFNIIEI